VIKKCRLRGKISFIFRQKQSVLNKLLKITLNSERQEIRHDGYRWGSEYSKEE
jgi:hypothetical protein